ncbi:MAG: amino acid transporter, partial [Opitutaceae bacterium]
KFHEGGWATLLVTGLLVAAAFAIKRHYQNVAAQLHRLDDFLVGARLNHAHSRSSANFTTESNPANAGRASAARLQDPASNRALNPSDRTAILLVNGYNGLGLHTAFHIPRLFGDTFRNFVFIAVGSVDAGNFKGAADLEALRAHTAAEAERYADWARAHGYGAATFTAIGHDITGEVMRLAATARDKFPNSVFFAGQLLFARETRVTRLLHNATATALQRRFFLENLPFVLLPIRV